jgi:hypothetical protein
MERFAKTFAILFVIGAVIMAAPSSAGGPTRAWGTANHAVCQLGICKYEDKYGK